MSMVRGEMKPKFLPTGSPQELAAFLRYRAEGHAHSPDIVVYAKPGQWVGLADLLEELSALRASAAPEEGMATPQEVQEACAQVADRAAERLSGQKADYDAVRQVAKSIRALIPAALSPDSRKAEPITAWLSIETAPENVQRFAKEAANEPGRSGYIEYCGTIEDGRPYVICRNNDGWQRFDRWYILPSVDSPIAALTPATEDGGTVEVMREAAKALDYLADHSRPIGGQEKYNAEHLIDIASRLRSRALSHSPSVGTGTVPSAYRGTEA